MTEPTWVSAGCEMGQCVQVTVADRIAEIEAAELRDPREVFDHG